MRVILNFITVISAIFMIFAILLQNQSSSLGSAFGAESNMYKTKRGAEKTLFYITIILAIVFIGSIIANFFVK